MAQQQPRPPGPPIRVGPPGSLPQEPIPEDLAPVRQQVLWSTISQRFWHIVAVLHTIDPEEGLFETDDIDGITQVINSNGVSVTSLQWDSLMRVMNKLINATRYNRARTNRDGAEEASREAAELESTRQALSISNRNLDHYLEFLHARDARDADNRAARLAAGEAVGPPPAEDDAVLHDLEMRVDLLRRRLDELSRRPETNSVSEVEARQALEKYVLDAKQILNLGELVVQFVADFEAYVHLKSAGENIGGGPEIQPEDRRTVRDFSEVMHAFVGSRAGSFADASLNARSVMTTVNIFNATSAPIPGVRVDTLNPDIESQTISYSDERCKEMENIIRLQLVPIFKDVTGVIKRNIPLRNLIQRIIDVYGHSDTEAELISPLNMSIAQTAFSLVIQQFHDNMKTLMQLNEQKSFAFPSIGALLGVSVALPIDPSENPKTYLIVPVTHPAFFTATRWLHSQAMIEQHYPMVMSWSDGRTEGGPIIMDKVPFSDGTVMKLLQAARFPLPDQYVLTEARLIFGAYANPVSLQSLSVSMEGMSKLITEAGKKRIGIDFGSTEETEAVKSMVHLVQTLLSHGADGKKSGVTFGNVGKTSLAVVYNTTLFFMADASPVRLALAPRRGRVAAGGDAGVMTLSAKRVVNFTTEYATHLESAQSFITPGLREEPYHDTRKQPKLENHCPIAHYFLLDPNSRQDISYPTSVMPSESHLMDSGWQLQTETAQAVYEMRRSQLFLAHMLFEAKPNETRDQMMKSVTHMFDRFSIGTSKPLLDLNAPLTQYAKTLDRIVDDGSQAKFADLGVGSQNYIIHVMMAATSMFHKPVQASELRFRTGDTALGFLLARRLTSAPTFIIEFQTDFESQLAEFLKLNLGVYPRNEVITSYRKLMDLQVMTWIEEILTHANAVMPYNATINDNLFGSRVAARQAQDVNRLNFAEIDGSMSNRQLSIITRYTSLVQLVRLSDQIRRGFQALLRTEGPKLTKLNTGTAGRMLEKLAQILSSTAGRSLSSSQSVLYGMVSLNLTSTANEDLFHFEKRACNAGLWLSLATAHGMTINLADDRSLRMAEYTLSIHLIAVVHKILMTVVSTMTRQFLQEDQGPRGALNTKTAPPANMRPTQSYGPPPLVAQERLHRPPEAPRAPPVQPAGAGMAVAGDGIPVARSGSGLWITPALETIMQTNSFIGYTYGGNLFANNIMDAAKVLFWRRNSQITTSMLLAANTRLNAFVSQFQAKFSMGDRADIILAGPMRRSLLSILCDVAAAMIALSLHANQTVLPETQRELPDVSAMHDAAMDDVDKANIVLTATAYSLGSHLIHLEKVIFPFVPGQLMINYPKSRSLRSRNIGIIADGSYRRMIQPFLSSDDDMFLGPAPIELEVGASYRVHDAIVRTPLIDGVQEDPTIADEHERVHDRIRREMETWKKFMCALCNGLYDCAPPSMWFSPFFVEAAAHNDRQDARVIVYAPLYACLLFINILETPELVLAPNIEVMHLLNAIFRRIKTLFFDGPLRTGDDVASPDEQDWHATLVRFVNEIVDDAVRVLNDPRNVHSIFKDLLVAVGNIEIQSFADKVRGFAGNADTQAAQLGLYLQTSCANMWNVLKDRVAWKYGWLSF